MATLPYVGPAQANPADLVNQRYLTTLLSGNLPQATVTSLINTGLAGYVTQSYVNTQAALNATQAYVDAGDAARLHLAQVGAANGVAGLNSSGKIDVSHTSLANNQRYPKPFYSPTSYWTGLQNAGLTEVQIDTLAVASPGFIYKLMVTGMVDGQSSVDGQYPIIRIRQGSPTGPVVAVAAGTAEYYTAGIITEFTTAGPFTWAAPSWCTTVDVIALGGGGGGGGNFTAGVSGGNSTVSTVGVSTLVGAGGPGGDIGITISTLAIGFAPSPQNLAYDGTTYSGGANAAIQATGKAPGGGGGGGSAAGFVGKGGVGGSWAQATWPVTPGQLLSGTVGAGGGPATGGLSGNPAPGATGAVWINAAGVSRLPSGPAVVLPTPLNAQSSISGATTLYVMLVASGGTSPTVSATTLSPQLQATPFPA